MKAIFSTLLWFWCFQCIAGEQPFTRVGYAYNFDNDVLVYTEYHHEIFSDGVVIESKVIYKDINGEIFAEKKLDFKANSYLPEFSLINSSTGHKESTRYFDNIYEVQFLESSKKKIKKKFLEYPLGAISDAGFDNFIISHWQEIISGDKFTRDFLIPGMLRFFEFRIYEKEIIKQKGKVYRVLHIEPASFLLRTFAGTSKLYYEYDRPVLQRFHGISNMRNQKGDNYKVNILYHKQISALTFKN